MWLIRQSQVFHGSNQHWSLLTYIHRHHCTSCCLVIRVPNFSLKLECRFLLLNVSCGKRVNLRTLLTLCPALSPLQPVTQNPKPPKCGFHKKLHQPVLLFSACLISSLSPFPLCFSHLFTITALVFSHPLSVFLPNTNDLSVHWD